MKDKDILLTFFSPLFTVTFSPPNFFLLQISSKFLFFSLQQDFARIKPLFFSGEHLELIKDEPRSILLIVVQTNTRKKNQVTVWN